MTCKRYTALAVTILIVLGCVVYSNTFSSSLHFDDIPYILNNSSLGNIGNLRGIWDYFPTRFIVFLTLAVNYSFGKLNVFGYHVVNLGIHLGSAILVWWLTLLIFLTPALKETKLSPYARQIALFVGMLFVVHPVQTESVTYISQRSASLVGFLYFLSLCLYFKSRLAHDGQKATVVSWIFYSASLIAGLMSQFTKENAVTLPLMILACEFFFFRDDKGMRWRYALPFLIMLPVIPVTLVFTKPPTFEEAQRVLPMPHHYSLWTQARVLVTYIRLLFLPFNQNLDYDYPVYESLMQLPVLMSFAFLGFILAAAVRLFRQHRFISFGIIWFFIVLLPESGALPLGDAIFEHRIYLALAGFGFAVAGALFSVREERLRELVYPSLATVILLFAILSFQRNKIWKDEVTLWSDVIAKSEHKARGYNNRGSAYLDMGMLDEALADFNQVLEINPRGVETYSNRGLIYYRKGDFSRAMEDYNKALEIDPLDAGIYTNRGGLYFNKGDFNRAIADYSKAIEINPHIAAAYYNRGLVYQSKNDFLRAISDYSRAIEIDPHLAGAYYYRAVAYSKKREFEKSKQDVRRAVELGYRVDPTFLAALEKQERK